MQSLASPKPVVLAITFVISSIQMALLVHLDLRPDPHKVGLAVWLGAIDPQRPHGEETGCEKVRKA